MRTFVSALVLCTVCLVPQSGWATITDKKSSENFIYKYEMNSRSDYEGPGALDLDGSGVIDLKLVEDPAPVIPISFANGICEYNTVADALGDTAAFFSVPTGEIGPLYSPSDIWPTNFSFQAGWTIEARVQVISTTVADVSSRYCAPFPIGAQPAGTDFGYGFRIGVDFVDPRNINPPPLDQRINTGSNGDTFHTWRYAQEPGLDLVSLWRDGVLLADTLEHHSVTPFRDWLNFGDSGGQGGNVKIDYIRLQPGAFAPGILGDVNDDDFVDIFDVNVVSANWGSPGGPTGDANGDGNVDIFDVNLISANWHPPASTGVPEPASAVLAALACSGLSLRMVRRKRA
jgi:hypothetical protein